MDKDKDEAKNTDKDKNTDKNTDKDTVNPAREVPLPGSAGPLLACEPGSSSSSSSSSWSLEEWEHIERFVNTLL
jgi:hypothetical protein